MACDATSTHNRRPMHGLASVALFITKCDVIRAKRAPVPRPWTTECDGANGSVAAPPCNSARQTMHGKAPGKKMIGGKCNLGAARASSCRTMAS
eukprot:6088883-Pyramimonas_sp.AAC.1